MKYISSVEAKEKDIAYHKIEGMVPWTIADGTYEHILTTYLQNPPYTATLDIGCGSGAALLSEPDYFKKMYGADIVSYLSDEAKKRIEFLKIDINFERIPLPDSSVDFVCAFQTIEHLENPFFIMREAKRILKPGGIFTFSVPSPYNITFRAKYFLTGNMPPWTRDNNHLLFLTRSTLEKTYATEFELVETIYQTGSLPFWGRIASLLRHITGKKFKKHLKVLPRSEWFGRRVCYVLKKSA